MANILSLTAPGLTLAILPGGLSRFTATPKPLFIEMRDAHIPIDIYVDSSTAKREEVAELIRTLRGKDWRACCDAAKNLGKSNDRRAVDALIRALRNRIENRVTPRALAQIHNRIRYLHDANIQMPHDKDIRKAAAKALGKIGDTRAVDALIAALDDKDVCEVAVNSLIEIGEVGVTKLIAQLNNENQDVRTAVARILGTIGDPHAVDALADMLLNDKKWFVRLNAAEALGRIGDTRAEDALIAALDDEHGNVREAATKALGMIDSQRAVGILIAALCDGDTFDVFVRRPAVEALAKSKDPRALDALIVARQDKDLFVRSSAEESLHEIKKRS